MISLAIIGGGVIGLSAALHAKALRPAWRVAIFDAPTNPGVASRAAAGMLAPYAEFHERSSLFELCVESLAYYPEFLSRFASGVVLHECGVIVPGGCGLGARAERIGHLAAEFGPVREMSVADVAREEPILNAEVAGPALLIPGALVNPRSMHEAMQAAAEAAGIEFVQQGVVRANLSGGVAETLRLGDGSTVAAERILIASGAWSEALGAAFGIRLDMIPVKGQVGLLAAPEGALNRIIHSHHIYMAPRRGSGILFGASTEEVGFEPAVHDGAIAELRARAEFLAPGLRAFALIDSWMGFRPRLTDGLPLIGAAPGLQNVWLATGHYRNGILLAPVTGRLVAGMMAG